MKFSVKHRLFQVGCPYCAGVNVYSYEPRRVVQCHTCGSVLTKELASVVKGYTDEVFAKSNKFKKFRGFKAYNGVKF